MIHNETAYHTLLMEYASGCLDEARALAVAAHVSLSPKARHYIKEYESIGGSLLHDCCTPVAMKADARQAVMEKISRAQNAPTQQSHENMDTKAEPSMPPCLNHYLQTAVWTTSNDGTQSMRIKTTCTLTRAELIKLASGQRLSARVQRPGEITLIVKGGISHGETMYDRGDLVLLERGTPAIFIAKDAEESIVYVVRPAAFCFQQLLRQALNYISR